MLVPSKVDKMKDDDARQRKQSTLDGDHPNAEYNETLNQMYDSVLASIDHDTSKCHRKKSLLRRDDDHDPKGDNFSTSTASSDGTPGHQYEPPVGTFEMHEKESSTSFLGGVVRGSTANLKKRVVSRFLKSWKAVKGCKPIEVFLHEARYPSDVRTTC